MPERVRILRVIEYEGPRGWVESQIINRAVKGEKRFSRTYDPSRGVTYEEPCSIKEAILGEVPIILGTSRE